MKAIFLVVLFFNSLVSYSQQTIDVDVKPNPLKFVETSLYPEYKYPMKKLIWIRVMDTLSIIHFNKDGNPEIVYEYGKNSKRVSQTTYQYVNKLKTEMNYCSKYDQSIIKYKYNAKNKITEWSKSYTYFDKNVHRSTEFDNFTWAFEYDNKGNLVKKYYVNDKNEKDLTAQYIYDQQNKLINAVLKQYNISFKYDKGLLVKRADLFVPGNQYFYESTFKYNDSGKLFQQSNGSYDLTYTYDGGFIKKCEYLYKKNKSNETIEFFYNNNALVRVEIDQSDYFSLSPFIFMSDYLFNAKKDNRIKLKIEFIYDSFKNITEVRYFVRDVYMYSSKFIYEYY